MKKRLQSIIGRFKDGNSIGAAAAANIRKELQLICEELPNDQNDIDEHPQGQYPDAGTADQAGQQP